MPNTQRNPPSTGLGQSRRPPRGIALRKAAHGIARTVSSLGRRANQLAMSVTNAAPSLSLSRGATSASALMPASRLGGAIQASMTKTVSVIGAGRHSGPISIPSTVIAPVHVAHLRAAERGPVYNLTIEGEHEFFANGVLVANCDALRYSAVWLTEDTQGPGELVYQPSIISRHY